MSNELIVAVNHLAWVLSNVILLTVFVSATVFVFVYTILFSPGATTAGTLVRRAILSTAGLALLFVLAIFVDGRVQWYEYPSDVAWWRPTLRLVVYSFVAHSFASLVILLFNRRFRPEKLRKAPDDWTLKLRKDYWPKATHEDPLK